MLHDKHKVPSVSDSLYRTSTYSDDVRVTKKTFDLQSNNRKCVVRNIDTCSSLMLFDILMTQFTCRSPFLHQGLYLPLRKEIKNMRNCTSQETLLGMELHKNLSSSLCTEALECRSDNYQVLGSIMYDADLEPRLRVSMKMLTEEIDSEIILTPYRTINAIGGMFGLTVGYSLANLGPLFKFIDINGIRLFKKVVTFGLILIALDDVAELASRYQSMPIGVQYIAKENNWTRDFPVISLCIFGSRGLKEGVYHGQSPFLEQNPYFEIDTMEFSFEGQHLQIPVNNQTVKATGHPDVGLCYSVDSKLILRNVQIEGALSITFDFRIHKQEPLTIQALFHQEHDFLLAKDLSFAPILKIYSPTGYETLLDKMSYIQNVRSFIGLLKEQAK